MSAWIVVGGTLVLLLLIVVVLVRQGSPAGLSDEDGKTPQRERFVVERPAGPDAERMSPDAARGPTDGSSAVAETSQPAGEHATGNPGADGSAR
jgi:hypothetical protein